MLRFEPSQHFSEDFVVSNGLSLATVIFLGAHDSILRDAARIVVLGLTPMTDNASLLTALEHRRWRWPAIRALCVSVDALPKRLGDG
jgi:hypothetical protein